MNHDTEQAAAPEPCENDLETRIVDLEQQLGQARDEQLRERAELENQRRRLIRDVEQARKFANEKLLADIIPVLDSLEAGLAASTDASQLREGVELTLRQLQRVAENTGLVAINPAGDAFDPDKHQAMSMVPASSQHPANTVVQVFQKGYVLNERLIRPALVVVAQ